jgi:phosphatidyl-myo-inositol dimannoside synthase
MALLGEPLAAGGGIAQFNRDLVAALRSRHAVHVLALDGPGRWRYALQVLRAAMRERPDVVFCGHLHLAPLAAFLARWRGVPLWLQVHGIEAWQRPSSLRRRAVARAVLVTAVSRYTRARLLEWAGVAPDRVKVLPNTVDARFTPGPKSAALVARLGLGGRRVLLTVGRLAAAERYKGHDRVIAALPGLLRLHPELCYVVVGDGDDRARLEAAARTAGVADAVRFAGAVRHEELPEFYRLADAFVMPSTGEGFGIVFLEAIACGVPAVGAAGNGAADPLGDDARGLLVEAENGEALARAIEQALARPPTVQPHPFRVEAFTGHVARLVDALGGRAA